MSKTIYNTTSTKDVNKNIFYVYGYIRPKNSKIAPKGTPYYIGKGSNGRAYKKHENIYVPKDINNIVFIATDLSENTAFYIERLFIACYGRKDVGTGILLNRTDGGEGPSGRVSVRDKNGNTFSVPVDDSRLLSSELIYINTGMVVVKDKDGNFYSVPDNDPDYLAGILVHNTTGTKRSQASKNLMAESHSGENNYRFSGWYHVPQYPEIKFTSPHALEDLGLGKNSMLRYCKKNTAVITKSSYIKSKFLQSHFCPEIIGKTFKDIGFWFEYSFN